LLIGHITWAEYTPNEQENLTVVGKTPELDAYPKLFPGDIFGARGEGLLRWLCGHFLTPRTDRVHFGVIGDYLPWDDDYVILESIGKGIAVGRLSFYDPEDIEVYRVALNVDPDEEMLLRAQAAAELSRVGRARYDYILYAQLALGVLALLFSGHLPPWKSEQFPYGRNKRYVCTEAAVEAWRGVGVSIVSPRTVPTPASIKEAELSGKLYKIYPGRD